MPIINTQFQTITCDGPDCKHEVTFEAQQAKETIEQNPWMKTLRIVQTSDNRAMTYHNDECELAAVAAGLHNPIEKKVIEMPTGPARAAVAAAAAAAARRDQATKDIKAGAPATLTVQEK